MLLSFAILCCVICLGFVAALILYFRNKAYGMSIVSSFAALCAAMLAAIAVMEMR